MSTTAHLAHLRLRAQLVAPAVGTSPADVAARLGAIQAQDRPAAMWAVALRSEGTTRDDVERAIAAREIVRTWPMRGTLHFVAAADARWLLELLTPRIQRSAERRYLQLGLDDETFQRSRRIIAGALARDPVMTRTALFAALNAGGVETAGQRGILVLQQLCMQRMLCFGPHAGREPAFTLFDAWIPSAPGRDRDESLQLVAERYFISHGPATLRDFVWWTGLTVSDARRAVAMAHPTLEPLRLGDTDYWMAPGLMDAPASPPAVHLLPAFDEILLGYTDRSAVLDAEHARVVVPGGNGVFQPILVVGGRVRGTWRRVTRPTGVELTVLPFRKLRPAERELVDIAAQRYAHFLGASVTWRPA